LSELLSALKIEKPKAEEKIWAGVDVFKKK